MPWNKKLYPPDWEERRARVLARAGQVKEKGRIVTAACCEFCGVENGAVGWRNWEGVFVPAEDWLRVKKYGVGYYQTSDRLKIVLTVAHLDHDPTNHDVADERLAALCQKCHNDYDRPHRLANAAATRRRKAGLASLF